MMPQKIRHALINLALLLAAILVGLFATELGLRLFYPVAIMAVEAPVAPETGKDLLVPDPMLGISPDLGVGPYDANGIYVGRSVISTAHDGPKILFMGDSVTAHGQIVNGLAKVIASDAMSIFNGGVEGYNIQQEVEFFFRYQTSIKPDAIIHQLHINDLQANRFVLRTRDGMVRIYSPRLKPVDVNQTLYRHSQVYRFVVGNLMTRYSKDELKIAAFESLRRMRDHTRENGIPYHPIVFPLLQPLANWNSYDRDTHDYLLRISRELELNTIDLQPIAERLLADGLDPRLRPGDEWHPNQIMGDEVARRLAQEIPILARLRFK